MKNKKKSKQPYSVLFTVIMALTVLFIITVSIQMNGQTNNGEDNPLLKPYDTPFNVPPFEKIKAEHFIPAVKEAILLRQKAIDTITGNPEAPTFANTIEALDVSSGKLDELDYLFNELNSSESTEQLRKLSEEISPLISRHRDDIKLNEKLFQRIKSLYEMKNPDLSEEQRELLDKYYKSYAREGANLSPEKKLTLKEINGKLAELEEKFKNAYLKETSDYQLVIEKKEDLDGLPQGQIDAAANAASERGLKGKWVFGLARPSIFPFLQYSTKRNLREKIFKAYIDRGANQNKFNTETIINETVNLRSEKVKLLGYQDFAELTLEPRMAKNSKNVFDFLNKLLTPVLEMAKKEAKELQALIDKEGGKFKLEPWDWWFYAEKLRKIKYALDDEIIRPYFKLENVRDGAFYVANKLWGLKFIELTCIPNYNKDVKVYEAQDADGSHLGILYMDFFQRSSKRSGAWMAELRPERKVDGKRIPPVVTNNHNFSKPTADNPTLLNLDEVKTLFHEFGHGLHGLLADCTYPGTSGTNVALDFVELPSQVMENWATEPEVLNIYAKHYKTGEIIPKEMIDNIQRVELFNKGFEKLEMLASALMDMNWHTIRESKKIDVKKFESDAMKKINLIREIIPRYRSPFFNHIFGSGYPAGYYSYLWAEVLDADAFAAFKETGKIFDQKTAEAFRKNILEKGSSAGPEVLYKRFRGAEPNPESMLKRSGIPLVNEK